MLSVVKNSIFNDLTIIYFNLTLTVYNQWFKENGGSIVNIIVDMWRGFPMMSHTGAARHAVFNLTQVITASDLYSIRGNCTKLFLFVQSLAVEWAENGVRINAIAPGYIESPTAAANYKTPNVFNELKEHLPSKRAGRPEEVSSAVCSLLSPGASFISGTTLKVDCGSSLYTKLLWNINGTYTIF